MLCNNVRSLKGGNLERRHHRLFHVQVLLTAHISSLMSLATLLLPLAFVFPFSLLASRL
jgi:hypothetical protein